MRRRMPRVSKSLLFVLFFVLYNATVLVTGDTSDVNPEGINGCDMADIGVSQSLVTGEGGIPGYSVQISNLCTGNCTKYDVHLSCGMFSSTRLVNPTVFRRIADNDCLVNDGQDINPGAVVSFRYFNNMKYDLKVSSIKCR